MSDSGSELEQAQDSQEVMRTYVCPACGYDSFRAGKPNGTIDFNITWACPACQMLRGMTVWMTETSDPRTTP